MDQSTPNTANTANSNSEFVSPRGEVLETAYRLTMGDRNATYGDPTENMAAFTALVHTYIHYSLPDGDLGYLSPHDGAMIMVLAKVARIMVGSKPHKDNYIDGAAYLAMAWEATQHEAGN